MCATYTRSDSRCSSVRRASTRAAARLAQVSSEHREHAPFSTLCTVRTHNILYFKMGSQRRRHCHHRRLSSADHSRILLRAKQMGALVAEHSREHTHTHTHTRAYTMSDLPVMRM